MSMFVSIYRFSESCEPRGVATEALSQSNFRIFLFGDSQRPRVSCSMYLSLSLCIGRSLVKVYNIIRPRQCDPIMKFMSPQKTSKWNRRFVRPKLNQIDLIHCKKCGDKWEYFVKKFGIIVQCSVFHFLPQRTSHRFSLKKQRFLVLSFSWTAIKIKTHKDWTLDLYSTLR